MKNIWSKIILIIIGLLISSYVYAQCQCTSLPPQNANVTTYHNDSLRTGWNQNETFLTASSFPSSFNVTHTVSLDDQVDAQPLFLSNVSIAGSVHNVVYVVTENNTIYAIDSVTGAILVSRNLGSPVSDPFGCINNPANIGILSTPVIDNNSGIMYVVAYLNNGPTYKIYAIDVSSLQDRISPVIVSGSHTLVDGSIINFNASVQRQRAALLLQDGNVYVAFTSFCDFNGSQTRGWVLGWNANNLSPLASNEVTDTLSSGSFFLSTIWMSGYGLSGTAGNIYFTTGNSASGTYTGTTNIQESAVGINETSFNLNQLFTEPTHDNLDNNDIDFGSGGLMLLPDQSGSIAHLAIASGKDGIIYFFNRDNFSSPLATYQDGECWCGPSYFMGSDGIPRVVTSQGTNLEVWKVNLNNSPTLSNESSVGITTGQDPGFFTSISSNGTNAGSAIIWAVGHNNPLTLNAFNASGLNSLFSGNAGQWINNGGNANIVPTVANGHVYVGGYKSLTIFGVN